MLPSFQLGRRNSTQKKVENLGSMSKKVINANINSLSNHLLSDFIEQFINSLDNKDQTKQTYRKGLEKFSLWIIESCTNSPQRQDILLYKAYLQNASLSPLTISTYLVALRRFFAYLESIKVYPNIAKDIKGLKRPQGFFRDTLTKTQAGRLMAIIKKDTIENLRDFALINLMLRTGLRTIEIIRTDIQDITTKGSDTVLYVWGKARDAKDEFVVLTPDAYNPLMDYLKLRKNPNACEPLFINHSNHGRNKRLTTRSIRRIVQSYLEEAGFKTKKMSAHSLRHSAATIALQNGADVMQVRDMLRHSNINTTMIYVHNLDRIEKAAEKFISF